MTKEQLQRIKDIEKHMKELREECEQECSSLTKERIKILSACDHKQPDGTIARDVHNWRVCEYCWEPIQGSVRVDVNT